MPKRLKKCKNCGEYTVAKNQCPFCQGELKSVYPPKFSLGDKYQKYRIPYFLENMEKKYGIVPKSKQKQD